MPPLAIAIAIAIVIVTAIAIVAAIGLCFGLPSVLPAHRRRLPPAFSPLRHSAAELADGTPPNSMFGLKKKIRAPRAADAALSPGMSPKPSVGVLPGMSPKLEMDLPELDIDTNLGLADSSYSSDLPETVSSPIVSPKPVRSLRFDNVIHHIPTPSHETDTRILSDSDSDDPHDHTFSADDEEERTAAGPGTNSDRIDPRNEQRKGKSGAVSSDDGDDDVPLGMLGDGARAPSEFTSIKAEVRLEKYMKKTKRTSRLINPDDNLPLALTRLQLQEQMPAVSLPPDSASPKLQPSQQLKRTPTASAANLPSPKMPDSSPRQPHAAPSANPHSGHNRSLHDPAVDTVPHRRATEYPSPYDNQANGKKITARVYIQDASTFTMMVLTPQMNSVQVTSDLVVRSNLDPLLGWTLFEICNDFGVERPLRDWEIVSDVVSSWDSSNSVNAIVLKVYGLRDTLLPESIIGRYPKVQGWVHLEIKPGKWQRRFLSLKDGGVSYFKDGESGSQVFLCSLGAFDVYTLCKKRNRAPTNFCFALKSTSSISFFENKDDYIKFVCVDREDRLFDWVMSLRIAQSEKTFSDNPELFDNLSGIPPQAYERRLRKFQKEDVLKPNPILSGTHSSGHVANAGLPDHRMSRRDRAEETSSPYGRGAFDQEPFAMEG
ncbi:uncharacterized protein BJ171DRAFT_587490 [Polychytrium aggregatum]|uniref:uncharacterized protein n=1 Tax=Polychytrium aggregatum TaxID=110093 RepID=UPI0022FE6C6A|nr:uncharacterized protein BJ171DRAFT_587490 [Polychytrium aggregatum]KAI9193381.1 hypothetical protein BJ171DRAFT_587490 [Polychytrium aggregatum]